DVARLAPVEGEGERPVAAAEAGVAVGRQAHVVERPEIQGGGRCRFDADVVGAAVGEPEGGVQTPAGDEGDLDRLHHFVFVEAVSAVVEDDPGVVGGRLVPVHVCNGRSLSG